MSAARRQKIIVTTNSAWTLHTFRLSLILALKERGHDVVAAAPYDDQAEKFKEHGIRFLDVAIETASRNPLRELATVIAYRKLYAREKPDLVHHFSTKPILLGGLAARLCGVPHVMNTFTGLGFSFKGQTGPVLWAMHRMARMALPPGWRASFQNPEDLQHFLNNGICDPDQASLIRGSGINTQVFAPRRQRRDDDPVKFLMYGRLIPQKGVFEYLEAARRVRDLLEKELGAEETDRRTSFVLIGGADETNSTGVAQEWISNPWTISGQSVRIEARKSGVTWLPHQEPIEPFLHEADVVVLPSYFPEGLPRSLLEAMACGKAVITTDTAGCRDTTEPGVNGFLVPPQDAGALADAMLSMARNPAQVTAMGKESRRKVCEEFSDERVIADVLREYGRMGLRI